MREEIREKIRKQSAINYEKVAFRMRTAICIDNAMKSLNISSAELARRMNKRPSEICNWLSGTHNFTGDTLVEISQALGVTINPYSEGGTIYQVEDYSYKFHIVSSQPCGETKIKLPKNKVRISAAHFLFDFIINISSWKKSQPTNYVWA